MPRDGSNNYTLPEAPFASGTTILPTPFNSNFSDLAAEMTDSVCRSTETTAFTRSLLDDANAATFRATLGIRAAAEVVAEATASGSATLDLTAAFNDALYDSYTLELLDLVPVVDDAVLWLRVGTGAGPTWQIGASDYQTDASLATGGAHSYSGGTGAAVRLSDATTSIGVGNAAGERISGAVRFNAPSSAQIPLFTVETRWLRPTGALAGLQGQGAFNISGAFTSLRVMFNTGNIATGKIRLLGHRKAGA